MSIYVNMLASESLAAILVSCMLVTVCVECLCGGLICFYAGNTSIQRLEIHGVCPTKALIRTSRRSRRNRSCSNSSSCATAVAVASSRNHSSVPMYVCMYLHT